MEKPRKINPPASAQLVTARTSLLLSAISAIFYRDTKKGQYPGDPVPKNRIF